MKTLAKLVLLFGIIVYLIFAFTNFTRKGNTALCQNLNITIADSIHSGFINEEEAKRLLIKGGLLPIGKQMDSVNCIAIENELSKNKLIDSVSCYKSPGGTVNIIIEQRLPLMRILTDNGDSYYLDERGKPINPQGYIADLIVATGHISTKFAQHELLKMAVFLSNDPFWDSQIEQINVLPNKHLQLVPRVGNHTIEFGTVTDISKKFQNLYKFYEKVMPQVGWNKYESISLENPSQIVAQKR